jgi:tRNA threonylcarbamoyladenosine biosynthesis protein TsaB
MKTIAIDTSLSTGSVAAIDGDRIAVRSLPTAGEHARLLAAAIEAVAAELGWHTAAAECVAVVRGPGSFTGLRVGVTTAKALCWATGSRLLGVSSCEVIARGPATALGRHDSPVTVTYDAGRGDAYKKAPEAARFKAALEAAYDAGAVLPWSGDLQGVWTRAIDIYSKP